MESLFQVMIMAQMTSKERVQAALDFRQPDRIPVYTHSFWPQFIDAWRREKGMPPEADIADYYPMDVERVVPDEAPFPGQREVLSETDKYLIVRTCWGTVQQVHRGKAWLSPPRTLEVLLKDKDQIDQLEFESPLLESRFPDESKIEDLKQKKYVHLKTGGPYLRTSNLRGPKQWLIDLMQDREFARELAMKVTDHITSVGLEALRRYDLQDTSVWFYDDMGTNRGPFFPPKAFRQIFLPCYRKMCAAYRRAGVSKIGLHCDGNIEPLLDMLVDAGINILNPVEPKAGMDVVHLRKRYGKKLAFSGGLDNVFILPRGDEEEIKDHVAHVLEAGRDGGLIIGTHSIGPDISVETYDFLRGLFRKLGKYPLVL
jgi:uroporphyrinogen decarboxylase